MKLDSPLFDEEGGRGGLCGCLAAAAFAAVMATPFLLYWWLDCDFYLEPPCGRRGTGRLLVELAAVLALAALLGFAVRALLRWSRRRDFHPEAERRRPKWAVAALALVGSATLFAAWALWSGILLGP